MRIVTARRISQAFFLTLFVWFCIVVTVGAGWWQLRGWPINWFLTLDPLTALATLLSTHTFYAPFLWVLPVVILAALLGRFFCGFVCPLGALNQLTGWISGLRPPRLRLAQANAHHRLQGFKYVILTFLLILAAFGSVQTGLLDPLPLLHRSINLTLTALVDRSLLVLSDAPRAYESAWLPGAILLAIIGLNAVVPRFFCRFLCPLGAFFSLLGRFAPGRIGKRVAGKCGDCRLCEEHCEGGCRPSGEIVTGDCLMCMNCLDSCPSGRIAFAARPSAEGEMPLAKVSRRAVLSAAAAGALTAPLWTVGALAGTNRNASLIRPPGALDEERFLERCIRCGQCMRACPSNIIQPSLLLSGVQGLWTPELNFRIGRSGCQVNCVACGNVCPTSAIRPLSLSEKHGTDAFADKGPIRIGTAFVDRTRCLPWVMDRPCIVCQELCPVSPKAIFTRTVFETLRDGRIAVARMEGNVLELASAPPAAGRNLGSGDYAVRGLTPDAVPRGIALHSKERLVLENPPSGWRDPAPNDTIELIVKLQQPHIDASRCIGCGMCEHECPVSGLRAIRVFAENESRSPNGKMTI